MALDKVLKIYDENGNPVDYDILASDVKFLPDGKDLPTKLAELEQEIEDAGSGDGTVTGVKVGSTTYPPNGEGVVDISPAIPDVSGKANKSEMSVVHGTGANADKTTITLKEGTNATVLTQHQDISGKVDKDPNKELIPSTDLAKLQSLPTATELTTQLGQKANDNAVVKSISVNNVAQQKDGNGNVNLQVQAGEQVSVIQPDPADGTFIIRVGSTDYTINLNHTHEKMCKLEIVDEEPSSPALDTIYALVDNASLPGEILSLWIAGLEFVGGGGGADDGTPRLLLPNTDINLGENHGSGLTKTVPVRAKNLNYGGSTTGLTIDVVGTGLTISYGQQTGLTTLTIPQANGVVNTEIELVLSGTAALNDGKLTFSQGATELSSVDVVASVYTPYVTNGLVFHLDGADASTSQWVDREGGIAFAMNNVTLDGNGGVVFNGTNSYGRYAAADSLGFSATTHTIEVVANIGGTTAGCIFMQNAANSLAFGLTAAGNLIYTAGISVEGTIQRKVPGFGRGLHTSSLANTVGYKDKVAVTIEQSGVFVSSGSGLGVFVGARDSENVFFTGTIYQIRVYNRLLTAEEILANQQIDIERYNIQ